MRVVVTGATESVGPRVVEALAEHEEIDEVVGLARRQPPWQPAKTRWVNADVIGSELEPIFTEADAVIHLAWTTQPSRDVETLRRINVDGSRRVFEAVAAAGVPKLVHASSVGAYSPGPRGHLVGEDWPVGGIETSFYSRHKAMVEEALDQFERVAPETQVVRLRPALIFKGEAASDVRRLFAGPFLPDFLLRGNLISAMPRLRGLCFQAVHSSDVGRAYALAAIREVSGAFNLAANPLLSDEDLAASLDGGTLPLPISLARRLADLSWRLRLQPTPPGWLDMAMGVPLISSERATRELGWVPRATAIEALAELLGGVRHDPSGPTPPFTSNRGARLAARTAAEKLGEELAGARMIEEQALAQMRRAAQAVGEESLAEIFTQRRTEAEDQLRRVEERIEAHRGNTSLSTSPVGGADGIGTVIFAESEPHTPAELIAHAFAYAHLEVATYGQLRRTAEAVGDEATATMARQIGEEEQRAAERIESCFEVALASGDPGPAGEQLDRCLAMAHAIENQGMQLLQAAATLVGDGELGRCFSAHLRESEEHTQMVYERMQVRGAATIQGEDAVLRIGSRQVGATFAAQPDTETKLTAFAYAFEQLEIATYELLARAAEGAGDAKVRRLARRILVEERAAADRFAGPRPG